MPDTIALTLIYLLAKQMRKVEKFRFFLDYFLTNYPEPRTELVYHSPYELLVAVVLSAQCTDKRVNLTLPALMERFPTPAHLGAATADDIYPLIRSISYPNNKAKHLAGLGRLLSEEFGGEVPSQISDLQRLPGVGRKTAHVVASVIYNQPAMAVDTHVFRVSRRIGLAPLMVTTPLAVEKALVRHIPEALISRAHHWLILHGRYICQARQPKCWGCPLTDICSYFSKTYGTLEQAKAAAKTSLTPSAATEVDGIEAEAG